MDTGDFVAQIAKAKAEIKSLSSTVNIKTDGLASLAAKTAAAGAAASAAASRFRVWGTGIRVTGNALHWLISGFAEFAAVAIPATVAAAAALAVMAPAAVNAGQHMQSLAVATQASGQMFGQTMGSVLGFSGALQKAQDAARPAVFGLLGSALITAKEGAGGFAAAGLQVTQMLQKFGARVAVDFGPGGALAGGHLFKNMAADLQGLGQVLGNIGHAFFSVANAMPGLAEFLLKGLSGISGFVSRLAGAAPILITVGIAFEELYRYGGLAASILARVGLGLGSVLKMAGAEGAASKISGLSKALQELGKTTLGKFQIAGVAALAIGVGFLAYKLMTARDAAQQFGDALQKDVMKAPNTSAMNVLLNNIGQLQTHINQVKGDINSTNWDALTKMGYQGGRAVLQAVQSMGELNAAMRQQKQEAQNVANGAQLIARTYGTTFVGALALADEANVKLAAGITGTSQSAMVARMQIASLVQGYQAMGQSSGEVGKDMTALAIQSGLAASGVSKLNSAWDDFTSNLTGGTSALASLGTDLTNLSAGTNNIVSVLGKAGKINFSGVQQFASSLKSFSGSGATAWQNFNKVISSGQQMIDWMRTAGAEGALSAKQFRQAGLDMASAFVPLASQSKTAQSELMGLVQQIDPSIQTFAQLKAAIANSGASFGGLNGIVGGATQKMAMMESVAQKLGTVLNSALVSALQAAQVQASGAGAAMQKYAQDLMDGAAGAQRASGDYQTLMGDLEKLGLSAKQAAALIAQVTANLNAMPSSKTVTVYTNFVTSGAGASAGINPGASGLPKVGGHAAGTPSAPSGWAWVGEAGPELVKFRGGETVLPNQVSMGFANGTEGPYGGDIHIFLDGRELNAAVSQRAVASQRRTGNNGMQKRTR